MSIGRLAPAGDLQDQYQVVPVIDVINHPVIAGPDAMPRGARRIKGADKVLAYAGTGLYHVGKGGDGKLKHYECVEVKHHKDVPRIIEEYETNGWHLHTYQTAGMGAGPTWYAVNHYLLFERDK